MNDESFTNKNKKELVKDRVLMNLGVKTNLRMSLSFLVAKRKRIKRHSNR